MSCRFTLRCLTSDMATAEVSARHAYAAEQLTASHAGEILTLQRAAYLTEAAAHNDFDLPPLTQTLSELVDELGSDDVIALGMRDDTRLVGAVRLRRVGTAVELGRLTVAPDRQGQGIGTFLLAEAERAFLEAREMRLFTGEHSLANIRLYERVGYNETERTPVGTYSLVHFTKPLR